MLLIGIICECIALCYCRSSLPIEQDKNAAITSERNNSLRKDELLLRRFCLMHKTRRHKETPSPYKLKIPCNIHFTLSPPVELTIAVYQTQQRWEFNCRDELLLLSRVIVLVCDQKQIIRGVCITNYVFFRCEKCLFISPKSGFECWNAVCFNHRVTPKNLWRFCWCWMHKLEDLRVVENFKLW